MKRLKIIILSVFLLSFFGSGILFQPAVQANENTSQKIVIFHKDVPWEDVRQYATEWEIQGVFTVMDLPMINALVLKVPSHITSEELADDDRVSMVEDDQVTNLKAQKKSFIKPMEKGKVNFYPWNILKLYDHPYDDLLNEIDKDLVPEQIMDALKNLKKEKLRIAIFDTGIYPYRKKIFFEVKEGIDLIDPIIDNQGKRKGRIKAYSDNNGHGTHVAGILAAALDEKFKWGKKAHVELYAVKVLDNNATGDLSNIITGLQWAIDNDIDIVNMSIGYRKDSFAVRLAIEEAYKAGLIMVAAAGNQSNYDPDIILEGLTAFSDVGDDDDIKVVGAGDGGAGDGGAGKVVIANELPLYSVMYPSRYPEVISVGASTMDGYMASFNNYDDTMDLMAQGENIISYNITNGKKGGGYGICSGTSMAAPHVTAAIAMMLAIDPTLGHDDIFQLLSSTLNHSAGEPVGELDLLSALHSVMGQLPEKDLQDNEQEEEGKKIRKQLKKKMKKYRKFLKKRIREIDDKLWEKDDGKKDTKKNKKKIKIGKR